MAKRRKRIELLGDEAPRDAERRRKFGKGRPPKNEKGQTLHGSKALDIIRTLIGPLQRLDVPIKDQVAAAQQKRRMFLESLWTRTTHELLPAQIVLGDKAEEFESFRELHGLERPPQGENWERAVWVAGAIGGAEGVANMVFYAEFAPNLLDGAVPGLGQTALIFLCAFFAVRALGRTPMVERFADRWRGPLGFGLALAVGVFVNFAGGHLRDAFAAQGAVALPSVEGSRAFVAHMVAAPLDLSDRSWMLVAIGIGAFLAMVWKLRSGDDPMCEYGKLGRDLEAAEETVQGVSHKIDLTLDATFHGESEELADTFGEWRKAVNEAARIARIALSQLGVPRPALHKRSQDDPEWLSALIDAWQEVAGLHRDLAAVGDVRLALRLRAGEEPPGKARRIDDLADAFRIEEAKTLIEALLLRSRDRYAAESVVDWDSAGDGDDDEED